MWIKAPHHKNFANNLHRMKFNKALESMAKLHDNMFVLELVNEWDQYDTSLYITESRRYTATGLSTYWRAVDKTVKYADTILLKKIKQKSENRCNNNRGNSLDRYHWHRRFESPTGCKNESYHREERCKMPEPPPHRHRH